jgi:hypothetical protein
MSQTSARPQLGPMQMAIIALAVATAVIHVILAIPMNLIMFYLNAVGYIALVAALYLPQFAAFQRYIRWALMAYTAVTILGWVAIGERTPIGFIDKAIEIALLVLLFLEQRRQGA